jgi:hypothetical protein
MIVTIATITVVGVLNAVRYALAASAAQAVKAYARTLNYYENLLYRRHDDDPQP